LRPDGGRERRPVYGRTRAEASAKLAELVAKTAAGVPLAVKSWTVQAYAEHWLADVVAQRLRPSTLASYRDTMRLHIWPTRGRCRLRALTPAHVRKLLAAKSAAGLSVRSVQIIHAVLRVMLAEAVRDELVERNVASIVRGPSASREEVRPWTLDEASAFLAASEGIDSTRCLLSGSLLAFAGESCSASGGQTSILMAACCTSASRPSGSTVSVWLSVHRRRHGHDGTSRCPL
jgi:integrase